MPSERNDRSALCARPGGQALHPSRRASSAPASAGKFRVRAFTLIEMLTVVAIIGILAAILIPTVQIAMRKARVVVATADVSNLNQAATAYNLDFGAFPPDCTAFWTPQDNPFPAAFTTSSPNQPSLNPNELLMWYLTMQFTTGQPTYNAATSTYSYPATGYPAGYPGTDAFGDWTPSSATMVFSRVNSGPYFDMKAKQKVSLYSPSDSRAGFYDFMDPWGRPYMYRAYPQSAGATVEAVSGTAVKLTLSNLNPNPNSGGSYPTTTINGNIYGTYFFTGVGSLNYKLNYSNSIGSIQLTGFTSNAAFNGTYAFPASNIPAAWLPGGSDPIGPNQVTLTAANPPNSGDSGQYVFPLHNKQTCDIYSLGPYGLTRAASMPTANGAASEWKPTHGGSMADPTSPWLDPTSLDAWPQVWGTPGDGNDINSTNGNIIINSTYQDNICNWN